MVCLLGIKKVLMNSIPSIAVIPFVNMSQDPDHEYFSDGITEEIINALTQVEGLKVIARTSSFTFKGKSIDVRTIGRDLGVSTVLEGSVRKSSHQVRISAKLISTDDGTQLWSCKFDRKLEDIFVLQDEISLQIAEQIRENFGHLTIQDHLIEAPTQNMEAYDLYLKGRYQHLMWDGQGIVNAVGLYEQSLELDSSFDLPYFGLAYSYAMYGSWGGNPDLLTLSKHYLDKGFNLSPHSYMGYFGQATLSFWGHWDFVKGYQSFHKAIQMNPSYTEAEEGLVELYTAVGLFDQALYHTDNILKINPLSHNHYFTLGNIHYLNQDYDKALECIDTSLSINPEFTHSIALKQICFILTHNYEELEQLLNSNPHVERPDECRALYQLVHPESQLEFDIQRVSFMLKEGHEEVLLPWQLFLLVHLKKHEMALDLLEENIKKRTGQFMNFMNLPLLKPLHQYQRFQDLVQETFPSKILATLQEKKVELKASTNLLSEGEISDALQLIDQGMKEERWFENPLLNLGELAQKLNLTSNKLSWLINEQLGKNFNEYINTCRLQHFKAMALNPKTSHLTILEIAYESGFNSKSVFNAFFKKQVGMTPKSWLKSQIPPHSFDS